MLEDAIRPTGDGRVFGGTHIYCALMQVCSILLERLVGSNTNSVPLAASFRYVAHAAAERERMLKHVTFALLIGLVGFGGFVAHARAAPASESPKAIVLAFYKLTLQHFKPAQPSSP